MYTIFLIGWENDFASLFNAMNRPLAPKPLVPPKETIHASFLSSSTHRQYKTYQTQFEDFCVKYNDGLRGDTATPDDCADFLHFLYKNG